MNLASEPARSTNHRRGKQFYLLLLAVLVMVLSGCSLTTDDSSDDGHRFATDERPTSIPTHTPTPDDNARPFTPVPTATAVPEPLINLRGAPQFTYLLSDTGLQVYEGVHDELRTIPLEPDVAVLDFDSSPTGDRVGLLAAGDDGIFVQFYGMDGEPLSERIALTIPGVAVASATPQATPMATPTTSVSLGPNDTNLMVSWVPQGNAVVVAGPNVLDHVSMSGVVMPITQVGVRGTVTAAYWSPMDSSIAVLSQFMDGHQGIYMIDIGEEEAWSLDSLQLQPGESVSEIEWFPNGLGLIAIVHDDRGGDTSSGQLIEYRFDQGTTRILATSAQGGPAATISHAVLAPDGRSIAYAVSVYDLGQWHLHSLWVKPLVGSGTISVPIASASTITALAWNTSGLVWQQANGNITVMGIDMEPVVINQKSVATPAATPLSATPETLEPTPEDDQTPRG